MHSAVGLLRYISYNLILSQIITGRWGPAVGTLLLAPPNVNFMPVNLGVVPPVFETENCVASQCPEFYSEDTLMLSQTIYLGLLWLGLIVLLNPSISMGNFTKQYLKPHWWLIINSMWIWGQATVPEDPKNDDEAANQPEKFEMPSLATQIAPEECSEESACE
ncbi:hypothetical protein DSO57_1002729 [Entomophthora muscae]|uniref:Uncharacterized protein n=1 Tax=Entomophthora muscae TaxID=34485 RepID=A0ACC2UUA0_9FUNG|nr:hypothetical protein DSO57_1002729 [Entomophthora muscae]